MKKKVIIIGGGPAGLTAAYTILKNSTAYDVTILESEKNLGGISKTVTYNNNKMDLGGHRFFSKNEEINKLWQEILPLERKGKHDPKNDNKVLLTRNRVSRIYYQKNFYDYPLTLKFQVFKNLGLKTALISGLSYIKSSLFKRKETNLENFYINRFGKKLYSIFFEGYTEKLWGRSPKEIDSSWGKQRVKGLSIRKIIKDYFSRVFNIKTKDKETSLIENFYYTKYGPGQMWEEMALKIKKMGGKILTEHEVLKIHKKNNKIENVSCLVKGKVKVFEGDYFISSMPIKYLISGMNNVEKSIKKIALNLPYRDFITVGLILNKINLKNNTQIKTYNNLIPDCWIYVQGKEEKLGRIQVFNNWSPYLIDDINKVSLGLEYFCQENDSFWNKSEEELRDFAVKELLNMQIISDKKDILDYHVEKVKKAYPAYFDSYKNFPEVKEYLNKISNLYCIGRNGQHRYNNMDHSMETAIIAAKSILNNDLELKESIWNVNTEQTYHEESNHEKNHR